VSTVGWHERGNKTLKDVVECVAREFAISTDDVLHGREHRRAKQIAIYLAHECTRQSFPQIANAFGGRTWKAVVALIHRMRKEIDSDVALASMIAKLKAELNEQEPPA
jgi:chromosomal replication initiation ATPase DnaA